LEAKKLGRNTVVQLGDGLGAPVDGNVAKSGTKPGGEALLDTVLVTAVPLSMAVEKLRGFVLDHHAEIMAIKADRIDMQIESRQQQPLRRSSDRQVPFLVELTFSEQRLPLRNRHGKSDEKMVRTRIHVAIRPKRSRDRRSASIVPHAQSILAAIQSYLMANQDHRPSEPGTTRSAVNMLAPWMKLRD
jgi:hypothetical protein